MLNLQKKKLYYSISEVSEMLGIKEYILRYWETQFSEVLCPKRSSGRRLYTQHDIEIIAKIRQLLHIQGLKIKNAKQALTQNTNKTGELHNTIEHLQSLKEFLLRFCE